MSVLTMTAGPVSEVTDSEARILGFHRYQATDILKGKGDPDAWPSNTDDIYIDSVTGSGPLYNVTLKLPSLSAAGTNPNLDSIIVGDKLIIGDDIDNSAGGIKQWYRYDVTAIGSDATGTSPQVKTITVKYIKDTASGGDVSPSTLHYEHDAYGASQDILIIVRESSAAAIFMF